MERLVAEACGDGDLVAALGAAAVEDGLSGLGGHANEEAVDLATAAAVGLKGALGHRVVPVSNLEVVCWPQGHGAGRGDWCGGGAGEGVRRDRKVHSTASLEYNRVEENRQRNSAGVEVGEVTDPVTEGAWRILHNGWCN